MTKATATEKLCRKKTEKKVRLESDFAGIKAGQMMFVATPLIVDAYIRAIPEGEHRTVPGMRRELARRNRCDGARRHPFPPNGLNRHAVFRGVGRPLTPR